MVNDDLVNVRIPSDLKNRWDKYNEKTGTSLATLIKAWIDDHLRERGY